MDQELMQQVVELARGYRERVDSQPVFPRVSVTELREALGGPLPEDGAAAPDVISHLARGAEIGLVGSTGPRYFGFVIGGSLPVTTAADWLTVAWDQNAGLYATSPAASVAEEVAAGWLRELFGVPAKASVGFVTGGGPANFAAMVIARHGVLKRAGWDVEKDGLQGAPRVHVVVGDEAHATIFSALRMAGFGANGVKRVPADAQGRMIASELPAILATCDGPTIVCAQAGNVNSGSFDPLGEIADMAHARGAWLHIDGAFGLWAAVSERLRRLVAGLERADSWAVDAHKWLNVPYDSGLVLCAHPETHRAALGIRAEYLVQTEADRERDNFEWVPEFSRRARGFSVYAAIKHLGRKGIAELVDRCCARARQIADRLGGQPGVDVLNDVVLNQVLVRFHDSDTATRAVIERVQREGVCWLGGTTWHGMAAMRISVSNWSTTERDIEMSAESILRAAQSEQGQAASPAQTSR
jgi:glutamate/tyrosine decarboxylase-like PLP-dependent enzyme